LKASPVQKAAGQGHPEANGKRIYREFDEGSGRWTGRRDPFTQSTESRERERERERERVHVVQCLMWLNSGIHHHSRHHKHNHRMCVCVCVRVLY